MSTTTIAITVETRTDLANRGKKDDTFDQIIRKLLDITKEEKS